MLDSDHKMSKSVILESRSCQPSLSAGCRIKGESWVVSESSRAVAPGISPRYGYR